MSESIQGRGTEMDPKPKQQKRRLDRRNAIRNIEFDASTSPSCPFDGRSHHGAGSLDISTISDDRTSFRLRGNDGEFDKICRSLGLSGPEDFAIPAEDWEARKSRSTLDHLTSPRFRIYQNSDIYGTGISEPAEDGLSDAFEAKARVSDDLKKGNDFSQLKNGLKIAQIEVRIRKNDEDPNGQVHSVRQASSVRTYRNSGSGIKGARPPVLAPPPLAMSPPSVENGLFSFDPQDDKYLNSPVNLGSVCSAKQGEKVEEGDRRIVAKQDIDRALVRDDSQSCSDTSNDGKVEDSSKMRPKSLYAISPNGTFKCSIMSWQKGECLGSGSFGTVYEGFTDDGLFFAVKEVSLLDQGTQGKQSLKQLEQEILLLSQFEHENIVQYLGTDKDDSKLYIFLELVTKGSLASLYRKYHLWDPQVSAYTRQILNGLNYLHSRNVVHRDIKCANILVHASGSVKLADFGLAKATTFNDVKSCKGTPFWMAPEVVNQKHGYGLAADIWSLGCTVLEMLTRQVPYSHLEGMAALFRIGRGKPPPIPDSLSADARDFILKCLQVNPEDRPPAAQLLEHPFVKRPLSTFSGPPSPYHNSTSAQKVL